MAQAGKVPLEPAIQIAWQIAQALDFAHEQHIIHRDIKPSNIMVETKPDGEVTFASAFETGDPMVMMNAVRNQEIEFPEDCPRKMALYRALAKEPSQRFASCMEFIETAAKSEPAPKGGIETSGDAEEKHGKHGVRVAPVMAALCIAAIAIGLAAIGGLWCMSGRLNGMVSVLGSCGWRDVVGGDELAREKRNKKNWCKNRQENWCEKKSEAWNKDFRCHNRVDTC